MRRAPAALALLAVTITTAAGCGGSSGEQSSGELDWTERPRLLALPGVADRVLQGRVRNDSLRDVKIVAAKIRVLDGDGRALASSAIFNDSLSKPLFPQDRNLELPSFDQERLGRVVTLRPGQEAPLTVGWREAGGGAPVRIDYGTGTLAIGRPEPITAASELPPPTGPGPR